MIEPMIYVGLPTSQQNHISKNVESVFEVIFKTMGVTKSKLIGRSHFLHGCLKIDFVLHLPK